MDPLGKGGLILVWWDTPTEGLYPQGFSTRVHSQSVNVFHHPDDSGILVVRHRFSVFFFFMSCGLFHLLNTGLPADQLYLLAQPISKGTHPNQDPLNASSAAEFHHYFSVIQHHNFRRWCLLLSYYMALHSNHPLNYILSK